MTLTIRPQWHDPGTDLRKTWRGQVSIDSARWLLRKDVLDALALARRELGAEEVRTVGMLDDDMRVYGRDPTAFGTAEAKRKRPNFQLLDTCFDQLLEIGIRPVVGTNFMPTALARQPAPEFHPGWYCQPPADLRAWASFIGALAGHLVDRYGREEVARWTFEVWNEPNLSFWRGTTDEWYELWAATWTAIKRVEPRCAVAGPSTARGEWLTAFVERTRRGGCPADVITTHVYNDDSQFAALQPFEGRHEGQTNSDVDFAIRVIRGAHAELRQAGFAGAIHWNEYGRSWIGCDHPRESAQEAAWIAMTMAQASQYGDRFAYWCLSDVFDQVGYGAEAFHGGFGLLSLQGLRKPAYQAFRLLDRLGERSLPAAVEGGDTATGAWVTRGRGCVQALIHAVAPAAGQPPAELAVALALPPGARCEQARLWRIGGHENDIVAAWRDLGAPAYLSRAQTLQLRAVNELTAAPAGALACGAGWARFALAVPGLALLEIPLEGTP